MDLKEDWLRVVTMSSRDLHKFLNTTTKNGLDVQ